jgi:hypothetical protein
MKRLMILFLVSLLIAFNSFALTRQEVEPFVRKQVKITVMMPFLLGEIPYEYNTVIGSIIEEDGLEFAVIATYEGKSKIAICKIVHITDGINEVGKIPELDKK